MNNPLKIIQLKAENIKRIKAVEINPDDNTVIISGENGQGKSSVLDAIWLALNVSEAGKEISQPIRNGENKAKSIIDLGDIKVTRTWTQKGTYLKVEPKEIVSKYGGAQSVLDAFIGKLSFDPLEFMGLKDKEQRDMLLSMVDIGIDLDAWEVKRKQVFDARTEVKRNVNEYEVKTIKTVDMSLIPDDTPNEEIDIVQLINQTQEANKILNAYEKACDDKDKIIKQIASLQTHIGKLTEYIDKVKRQGVPDPTVLQHQLDTATEINTNVRLLQQYNSDLAKLNTYRNSVETLNNQLNQMEQQKQDAIKAAKFPISGLGFSSSGVLFNDIPISQIATSEQIKVSMSIAMAFNPNLRVIIIKEGSLLDHKNLELVKQMVKDKDYQLWLECVDDTGKLGIVIEDGQVKEQQVCQDSKFFADNTGHNHEGTQSGPVPDENEKSKSDWSF